MPTPRRKSARDKDATLARKRALVRALIAQTTGLVNDPLPAVGHEEARIVSFFGDDEGTRIQPVETQAEIIPFPALSSASLEGAR